MSASGRVIAEIRRARRPMRFLGASGQLGYGIPTPAFNAGLERKPDLIGCDMGSIDIGPTYLGNGQMATSPSTTARDLRKVLTAARRLDIPLVIGSAGSAGARPHLEATLALTREIAQENQLNFRMAYIPGDVPKEVLQRAIDDKRVVGIDGMPDLTAEELALTTNLVGQMGMTEFQEAYALDIDVLIAGRACDTAIFSALAVMLGFPTGLSVHMAKVIECAYLCCTPGGRDSILAELHADHFILERMGRCRWRPTACTNRAIPTA